MATYVFGHKNPDSDSILSAIALSYLKNQQGIPAFPCSLGEPDKESRFVLDRFQLKAPKMISDVKVQVEDLDFHKTDGISKSTSLLATYNRMEEEKLATMAIVDEDRHLLGIVSIKDIAVSLISGDYKRLDTSLNNLVEDLDAQLLAKGQEFFHGNVSVIDDYYKTIRGSLGPEDIVIVGDRYDIIEYAINSRVQLLIIPGNREIPEKYVQMAKDAMVTMIIVPFDSLYTAKMVDQCNYIEKIMRKNPVVSFYKDHYLDDVKETMRDSHYRNYPVLDENRLFLGFISRKHVLNPNRKKVILIDHNEYSQSAEGIEEAEILEIIDHHKLGDISTALPISFRNLPVGSSCTIVHQMYKEQGFEIPYGIAGALISGILSDTLCFRSPTTTKDDRKAVKELNKILNLNIEEYSMEMFKAGTSLAGESIEDLFFKDYKSFELGKLKVGVSQLFTLDIESILKDKSDWLKYLEEVYQDELLDVALILFTDILKEGSYILYASKNSKFIHHAFSLNNGQGEFLPGIISRKKQVLPILLKAFEQMNL